jgi:hypothetical protein
VLLAGALLLLAPTSGRLLTGVDAITVLAATATLAALGTGVAHLDANRGGMAHIRGAA